jgi:hypothetical protein
MSTALIEGTFLNRVEDYISPTTVRPALYATGEIQTDEIEHGIRYARVFRKSAPSQHRQQPRVLRRLQGFLIEMQAAEARVAFIENGQLVQYDLPSDQLRRNGIETRNQPFQMDEIELQTEVGQVVAYHFQPLAKLSDAYIEPLNFDEERKRKRDLILKEFTKTKG